MDIFKKIKDLNLPRDSFLVVGSGTLAALGLRDANDIDLLVTLEVYSQLKAAGWKEHTYPTTLDTGLSHEDFEVVAIWHGHRLADLMGSAVRFDGIAFAHLDDVVNWKKELARQKDLNDLVLIDAHRAKHEKS